MSTVNTEIYQVHVQICSGCRGARIAKKDI